MGDKDDVRDYGLRLPAVRVSRSFRTSSSFNRSPQSSPSYKRQQSGRTPRRDDGRSVFRYFGRRIPWVVVIGLWVFLVFRMYSSGPATLWNSKADDFEKYAVSARGKEKSIRERQKSGISTVARDWIWGDYRKNLSKPAEVSGDRKPKHEEGLKRVLVFLNSSDGDFRSFQSLKAGDYFLGQVVGPYDKIEQTLLGPRGDSTKRSCTNERHFAQSVRRKHVVVLIHELSMTGSPLAMMELATEISNCGGKVSLVVLDRRGGLLSELVRRRLTVLRGKSVSTWRVAAKADLVVAGSAVCSAWIDDYLSYNKHGGSKIIWWIMENRRLYFDRSKHTLHKVRSIAFLSEIQASQWHQWSTEENVKLPRDSSSIVALSVNDDIAAVAGLGDDDSFKVVAVEKLKRLRTEVRKDMGLEPGDMVFVSLSSINPGKGQLVLLQAASEVAAKIEEASRVQAAKNDGSKRPGSSPMKLVLGSVGSKSNKPEYVEKMLSYLSEHPVLARSLFWTPATVSVSSLYAAADVYVMNAQGMGETFGRVTVEAMAFGLPILGTDAGGTREIVDANSTGLLHPLGAKGTSVLANNMLFLLNNATLGREMGQKGRDKVNRLYTKTIMYEKLALLFDNSTPSIDTRPKNLTSSS